MSNLVVVVPKMVLYTAHEARARLSMWLKPHEDAPLVPAAAIATLSEESS